LNEIAHSFSSYFLCLSPWGSLGALLWCGYSGGWGAGWELETEVGA